MDDVVRTLKLFGQIEPALQGLLVVAPGAGAGGEHSAEGSQGTRRGPATGGAPEGRGRAGEAARARPRARS